MLKAPINKGALARLDLIHHTYLRAQFPSPIQTEALFRLYVEPSPSTKTP